MGWLAGVGVFIMGAATWAIANEQILTWGAKALWFLGQVLNFTRRAAVKTRIEADLASAAKIINQDLEGAIPSGAKVKWVQPGQVEATLKDGKAIICLSYDRNERRKEVAATYAFVKTALLNRSRSYIDPGILDSVHLTVTNTALAKRDRKAQDLFIEEILNPLILGDKDLWSLCKSLEGLEDRGLLHQVLVRELDTLPDIVGGSSPKFPHREESKAFTAFLGGLGRGGRRTTSGKTEDAPSAQVRGPTDYLGNWVRVGIVFVAEKDKFIQQGTYPYTRAVQVKFGRGCRDVYLLALSKGNIHVVDCVASAIRDNFPQWSVKIRKLFTTAAGIPGVCVLVQKSEAAQEAVEEATKPKSVGHKQ